MSNPRPLTIEGYASVFNRPDSHNHVVLPGAFAGSVHAFQQGQKHIQLLWQHNQSHPIGHITHLEEDSFGLKMRAVICPLTACASESLQLAHHNIIKHLSVGYRPMKQQKVGRLIHLKELDLWEVSLVSLPANPWATIYFKSCNHNQKKEH